MIKKISLLIIIILLTVPLLSFGATNYYQNDNNYSQDPTFLVKTYYDSLSLQMLKSIHRNLLYTGEDSKAKTEYLLKDIADGFFVYFQYNNDNIEAYKVNVANPDTLNSINTHFDFGGNYINVPVVESVLFDGGSGYILLFSWSGVSNLSPRQVYIPTCLYGYMNSYLLDYARAYFNHDNETMINLLNSVDNRINETNSQLTQLNQWMSNEDDSDIHYGVDTPSSDSSSVDNVFHGIFMRFYNAFNGVALSGVYFPIPFSGGKSIYVRPDFTYNILNQTGLGNSLRGLLSSVWYFLVGMYIVKDIQKLYQDIKSGDIMTKTDTNVKADML